MGIHGLASYVAERYDAVSICSLLNFGLWDLVRYRPVSCKSTIYQNLAGILFSRWAEYAPAIVPVDQCGFVHRRYILDVLHRLFDTLDKVDLEAMLEACGAPVLAVLIHSRDLDKCFDRISHAGLWRVLCHACGYQATAWRPLAIVQAKGRLDLHGLRSHGLLQQTDDNEDL
jgi:hypothetical protein